MGLFLWDWGTLTGKHSHTTGLGWTRAQGSNSSHPGWGEIIIQTPLLQLVLLLQEAWFWSHPVSLWPGLERKAFTLSPSLETTSGKSPGNEPAKWQDPWL